MVGDWVGYYKSNGVEHPCIVVTGIAYFNGNAYGPLEGSAVLGKRRRRVLGDPLSAMMYSYADTADRGPYDDW